MRGGPLSPDELVEGAPHRPLLDLWVLEPWDRRGRWLNPQAHQQLIDAPMGPVARGGHPWDTEILAPSASRLLGAVLVLGFSDHPALGYAALYRQGGLDWSLAVRREHEHTWVFRSDGRGVRKQRLAAPPPEGEPHEVLQRGLEKLLRMPLYLADHQQFVLPELLQECIAQARTD
ncbi:MAG: hypothetical protein VX899_10835 [Myxococcota bacterium]|nr:hypothetical protein [Myxococcota bacterium]